MTSLKFGTSGLRGLVADLEGAPTIHYCLAFLHHLDALGSHTGPRELLLGEDLRPSSPGMAAACGEAAHSAGWSPLRLGPLPTPALALEAMRRRVPAIMFTGSHIPADRNGMKFYTADGEITKSDEAGIGRAYEGLRGQLPLPDGAKPVPVSDGALRRYRARYIEAFGSSHLAGLTVGVFQHSSVGRDIIIDVLQALGARPLPFAWSSQFIPVDTEAHRAEDKAAIESWARAQKVDAIVSADGDADRPLIADAEGRILRGDVVGLMTMLALRVDQVVTPVTSTSAAERVCAPATVRRTKVGSPFVIAGMEEAAREGAGSVAGFEANGGVLLGSPISVGRGTLPPLPTRDALLPIICVLGQIRSQGRSLARLVEDLGAGHSAADRIQNVPPEDSDALLRRLSADVRYLSWFFASLAPVIASDCRDGVRVCLEGGTVVHYRASGNAPELRCYVEAENQAHADAVLEWAIAQAQHALDLEQPVVAPDHDEAKAGLTDHGFG